MSNNSKKLCITIIFFLHVCSGCISQTKKSINQVCFKQGCFIVELALNDRDRQRGLQNRDSLGEKRGMLFVFPRSWKHSFWMKETHIPLDMIWIDYQRKIVHIEENVPPCKNDPCASYTPARQALYVLEVNAGEVQKLDLKINDQAEFFLKL